MIECETLSDKMPMVLHGTGGWTADEAAHLAACPSCRLEWELVVAGAALGDGVARDLDAEVVAQALSRRLAADRRRRRWIRSGWGLGLAAAASLLLFAWPGHRPAPNPGEVDISGAMDLPLAELEGVDAAVLEDILSGLDGDETEAGALETPGFSELAPADLEQLLQNMEG